MLNKKVIYILKSITGTNPSKKIDLHQMGCFLKIGWTFILVLILTGNWLHLKEDIQKEALMTLRLTVQKDLIFRAWATEHGGVYVPITNKTQPNTYLSHIEKRDVITSDGEQLTLLNPAYIMRQVYQIGMDNFGVYSRLTSLNPINPANAADPWETKSMRIFEKNNDIEEVSTITNFNNQSSIRLIKPFYIEEGCLKCHGEQGYQVGDLRGAISASIPLEPYMALEHHKPFSLLVGYGLIWLIGLGGISWFLRKLEASTQILKKNEARNRAMIEAIPDMMFRYNREGVYLDAEIKNDSQISQLIQNKLKGDNFIGKKVANVLPARIAVPLMRAIEKVVSSGEMQIVEHSYTIDQRQFFFEERLVLEGENEVISIVRDITNQKKLKARLEHMSFHDQLTGLHNRNYFENELKRLSKSQEFPISIISIDVNGLKLINDTLGHTVGDKLLTACAKVLKQSLRSSDVLARVGGDEFVAILPQTNEKDSTKIVDRIKINVINYCEKSHSLPLSLSLGVATAEKDTDRLIDIYKEADDLMYKEKLEKGTTVKNSIIQSLISSLKEKVHTSEDHEKRLKEVCQKIGKKVNLSSEQLFKLDLLIQVHDLGKLSVSNDILAKDDNLNEEEWRIIKQHPEKGYRIALSSPEFSKIADLILKHHERWDGKGYPLGLKGEDIPLECRIFTLANAFVSMTAHNTLSLENALNELKNEAGNRFDPQLVDVLISTVDSLMT